MELAAAGAVVSSLNAAFNLSKSFLDVQGAVKVQGKVIELQSQILSAQQSAMAAQQTQASLVDRIKELEAEIANLKKTNAEKDDYRLENVGTGAFVYSPKAEPTATQPNHWLCVNCFDRGQRSVLQNQGEGPKSDEKTFACATCKARLVVHWRAGPHRRGEAAA